MVKVRRFIAVDDCGTRINPMIIEGQVHGGLTDGVGMALMEMIAFDEDGNCLGASLMDYLIPTALEVPDWETGFTVTPSPHHPIGAKGVGESATVGSPPAIVNAVVDALKPYGVRHADMPLTPSRVWDAMRGHRPAADLTESDVMTEHRRHGRGTADRRSAGRSCTPPSSARSSPPRPAPGDAAVILADGSIEGFVGGQCAESSVRTAALDTLRDGRALLLRVLPDSDARLPGDAGRAGRGQPVPSGGALEIFLRPMLPGPAGRVVGTHPDRRRRWPSWPRFLDFEVDAPTGDVAGATAVVVAGLGTGEEAAIRAALDAGVGLHRAGGQPRRGAAVLAALGLTEDERARVQYPGRAVASARVPPPEIALSILAEIVAGGPAGRPDRRPLAAQAGPAQAGRPRPGRSRPIDPVCGMTVVVTPDTLHAVVDGEDYWFCGPGCLDALRGGAPDVMQRRRRGPRPAGRGRLPGRRRPGHGAVPGAAPGQAAAARGRAGRRQDGGGQGAGPAPWTRR